MLFFNTRGIRHVEAFLFHSKRLAHKFAAGSSSQPEWIENVETQRSSTLLNVTWSSGQSNRFPLVYLRENCLCPSCFHGPSRQRAIDPIEDVDVNSAAKAVHVYERGRKISIKWHDNHVSEFDSDWLFSRRLPSRKFENPTNELASRDVEAWDSSLTGNIPEYPFEKIFAHQEIEFNWLKSMSRLGVAILNDVPMQPGQIERLSNHLGYIKQTVFGKTFQVRSKINVSTLAYTSRGLTPHTDIPPLEQRPGVQLLHCIKQVKGSGGVNTVIDGLNVAQKLKRADLGAFGLLTTKRVTFFYHGNEDGLGEFMIKYIRPIIELDSNGKLVRLSISDRSRQDVLDADAEELHEWYHAYFKLIKMLRAPENTVDHKLKPGELLVMDNDRLAHGRTAFSGDREGDRWLEGGYVDWDLLHSRLRVLSKKLSKPHTDAP